ELIQAIESVNQRQKRVLLDKIVEHFDGNLAGRTFAVWGLAFKPKTDDMRDAPSRAIIEGLWEHGARVQAYDPEAMDSAERIYGERPDFILASERDEALLGADALIICTEWRQFRSPDFGELRTSLKQPLIFDGRNMYDPDRMEREGITYIGIGMGDRAVTPAPAVAD
ncbi:MAG: UDP binding domain-containing protein, partial [Thermomicrobiales bacterium]